MRAEHTHRVFVKIRNHLPNDRKVFFTLSKLFILKCYVCQSPQHIDISHTFLLPGLFEGFQALLKVILSIVVILLMLVFYRFSELSDPCDIVEEYLFEILLIIL